MLSSIKINADVLITIKLTFIPLTILFAVKPVINVVISYSINKKYFKQKYEHPQAMELYENKLATLYQTKP